MKLASFVPQALLVIGAIMSTSCSTNQNIPPKPGSVDNARQGLRQLEERYEAFRKPIALEAWQKAVGEKFESIDTFEKERHSFYADLQIDSQLETWLESSDREVASLAKAWLDFRRGQRFHHSPEIEALNDRIDEIATGADKDRSRLEPLLTLYTSPDPDARREALHTIQQRMTNELLPLLEERARILNELAAELDAPSYLALRGGLPEQDPLEGLKSICDEQIRRSSKAWENLLSYASSALGREPGHADYLALAVRWTTETSGFFKPDELPALANDALGRMGFDVQSLGIQIELTPDRPGGAAYGISIPDDVRFRGYFPPGFEGARGWFHELGHAIHMKMIGPRPQPLRMLPGDAALSEGIGEIFTRPLRNRAWLKERFDHLTTSELDNYLESVAAFDAYAVREYCMLSRVEATIHAGQDIRERFSSIYEETFGESYSGKPFYDLVPYLKSPLYSLDYILAANVTQSFVDRLGKQPLLSIEAGKFLRETLLEPGNSLTLEDYIADRRRL